MSRQVTSFSDVSINNAVVLLGNISFSPRVKSPIEFSLNLILSGASVYSERLNFYLSGIYGKVPINSMENKMRERLFIKNANIKNIELDNIRTVISSSNSLLNLDDIEYNIYGANGRGSADLSLDKTLFNLELEVKSLDLEKLDNASKGFKTKTKGLVDLYLLIRLMGHEIGVLDIRANSVEAGQIEQELILALLNYLPKEKQTGWLIDELAKEGEFVYDEFKGEFSKKKDKYFLNLTLDGRHLIEFDISVEEEALGTLIDLLR